MAWVGVYQYGTAVALSALWLILIVRSIRRHGARGLLWGLAAPLFVLAWYVLEFGAFVYGCYRLSGAGC